MPTYLNQVTLAGNLTRDPELKFSAKGTAVCNFGIAINETWSSAGGEKKESVAFIDVTAFGKTAEAIGQYMKKGRGILILGKLRTDSWDDKQTGQKRTKLGVVLDSFQFVGGGDSDRAPVQQQSRPAAALPVSQPSAPVHSDFPTQADDNSVPF